MLTIATLTWLLLICISVFICCCNYWELFWSPRRRRRRSRASSEQEDVSEQSELELEQQSMLLTQFDDK
ncbi:uncharacterized protein LOC117784941 [Drosophila innubila]|uniref:uncharacterized protein LOC117784941 n=1 Tax=Drosophila innubila TaxID=198719 RepID=UPI00148CAFEC|nr:uncharacterized protein LOC117784941 [Drosophila innubila]